MLPPFRQDLLSILIHRLVSLSNSRFSHIDSFSNVCTVLLISGKLRHNEDSNSSNSLRMFALNDLELSDVLSSHFGSLLHIHGQVEFVTSLDCDLTSLSLHFGFRNDFFDLLITTTQLLLSCSCCFKDVLDVLGLISLSRCNKYYCSYFGIATLALE